MKSSMQASTSRREFIKTTGKLAAVSALANVAIPAVHAAGSDLIQVALIGCGGRGGGAAANALSVKRGPVKLVAMADIFPERLQKDLNKLQKQFASQVDVPPDRQFIGFDAYQKAMDCLKPGDIAIFATPPAFRWVHFTYAIQKGLNVFMEKPLTADGPTSKRMFEPGARGPGQEPEGRCGVDVASQPGDAGTGQARPRWRDWRDHSATGLPDARARRIFHLASETCRYHRPPLPGAALPQFHLGQRRLLQRLLYPLDRSVGVDEERVAREGAGAGRPAVPLES